MLRQRFFRSLTDLASSGKRTYIYILALVLTIVSALLIPRLTLLTTRQGMVSDDLPVQADFNAYMENFGSPTQLIVVLEGDTEKIKPAADALAHKLSGNTDWVRNVFHRVDVDAFRKSGLYYLSTEELRAMREFLEKDPERTRRLISGTSLLDILGLAETETAGLSEDSLSHPGLTAARSMLATWESFLKGESEDLDLEGLIEQSLMEGSGSQMPMDPDGFLLSDDKRLAFLFVQQAKKTDDASFIVPFMDNVRETADEVLKAHSGVSAGYTGWPAMIEEDYLLLVSDLPRVSLLATIIILALFLFVFRSIHRTILVFLPLALGVVWNLGLTVLTIGHLNYLSSVFVGILFGMGIDFGIYFVRRFDEERLEGATPNQAVFRTLSTAGQGIVTGGVTAIVAFLAIGFTDQPAFAELGIVAGMGVATVLFATMLLLPALLVQFPPGLKNINKEVVSPILEKSASRLLGRPWPFLIVAIGVFVLAVVKLPSVEFDYNLNNLLPSDSKTMRVLRDMEKRSSFSDQFVVVIADNVDQVRELHTSMEQLDTVRRVESLASALPENVTEKKAIFENTLALLPDPAQTQPATIDLASLGEKLDGFIEQLEEAEEDAFAAGKSDAVKVVGGLLTRLESIRGLLGKPEGVARHAFFEKKLFAGRDQVVEGFRQMLTAEPITLATLDPSLRERFVGTGGRMAVLAFPSQHIWDLTFLDLFVNGVRDAAEQVLGKKDIRSKVTGFAVTYQVTAPMIRKGFNQATLAAGIVVILMLLIDLRRIRPTLVALVPLVTTVLLLLGAMAWLGIALNMATQIAFPILFGLGVAYGVHMIHRMSEPRCVDPAHAVGTTGKAIVLAAATTMAGFGALMMAHHTALVSFGTILFTGIFISAVSALYGLPLFVKALKIDCKK